MMMARPCFVALLCVALWCGVVFGQEKNDATDAKEDTTVDNDASPDQQPPKEMVDEAASSTTSSTTTTTEGSNAAPGEEASSSTDENGAATLSVSLSSLMLATLLAKVYAH